MQTCRFIPTCVGSILSASSMPVTLPVHPHVCGEHRLTFGTGQPSGGSSPRVWGAWVSSMSSIAALRFIPTCVGSIKSVSALRLGVPVHPHVCGEHSYSIFTETEPFGSSPRVWGALGSVVPAVCVSRFIPTCVGSMCTGRADDNPVTVHPHVCGEHY